MGLLTKNPETMIIKQLLIFDDELFYASVFAIELKSIMDLRGSFMRSLSCFFQEALGLKALHDSAIMRFCANVKASAEEIERRKQRRENPSEENMLWCWKHRGIW